MKKIFINEEEVKAMKSLPLLIKKLNSAGNYKQAFKNVYDAMSKYPDNPVPHNLLGILLEKSGDHNLAMKHFRIAWILDPTYEPANQNLLNFGDFYSKKHFAYSEEDCPKEKKESYTIIYDDKHIGHVVKKNDYYNLD